MTAEHRPDHPHDEEVAGAPRQPKYAYDAQGGFEADLGVLPHRDLDIERKREKVVTALVKKKELEAINAYNLDVDLGEEGNTTYIIPPVELDISSQEVADIKRICGDSVLSNSPSMNDQAVRRVYRAFGASYPDDTVGDVPGEEEARNQLPVHLRIALSKMRVTYTPSHLSPFVFQRIGVIGSDNQVDPDLFIHRFIKTETQVTRPSGTPRDRASS